MEVTPINLRDAADIERAVTAFSRSANGGLIVTASSLSVIHRDLIITLAAQHRLPAIYFERFFVTAGGLISYGPDQVDQYRQAAGYVDRILKGEKPADLPVQAPTKYELVINLKTAKALGLTVPPIVARPPSPLTMLLSRHTRRRVQQRRSRRFLVGASGSSSTISLACRRFKAFVRSGAYLAVQCCF